MKIVNLADGSFIGYGNASNLSGDCRYERPQNIRWNIFPDTPGPIFITDMYIKEVDRFMGWDRRIGWLLEPPSLSENHYVDAVALRDKFYKILTFRTDLIDQYPDKFLFYPFGGSWIAPKDWGIYPKTKSVSMIASQKVGATGHKLRHAIAHRFLEYAPSMGVDVMGYGYRAIASKLEGLRDYRYSIVVESCQCDDYFSEKLIDCLSCGTIPIYWGSRNITNYFNTSGILRFNTLSELESILELVADEAGYRMRWRGIEHNFEIARRYRVAEDWIFNTYPELFEGCVDEQ